MKPQQSFPWVRLDEDITPCPQLAPITSYLFPLVPLFSTLVFSQVPVWFLQAPSGWDRPWSSPGMDNVVLSSSRAPPRLHQPHPGPAQQIPGDYYLAGQSQGTRKVPGGSLPDLSQDPPALGGPPWNPLQRPRRWIKHILNQTRHIGTDPPPSMGPRGHGSQPRCRRGRGANPG